MKEYKKIKRMYELKGLPEALKTAFPSVNIQTCIVNQIKQELYF